MAFFSLSGALVASLAALYIFYLQPWIQITSPLDPWLANQRCWIEALCKPPLRLGHQLGLLLVAGALAGFAGAFWGMHRRWGYDSAGVQRPVYAPASLSRLRRFLLIFCGVFGASMVAVQAFLGLQNQQAMQGIYWVLGLLAWTTAVALWDSADAPILVETVRKLAIAGAGGLILLALGGSLMGNPRSLLLLAAGVSGLSPDCAGCDAIRPAWKICSRSTTRLRLGWVW